MPERTQHYRLDTLKQGSYYSALSDKNRFLTLDYNLKSYVGIVGAGILSGWTIDIVSGLTIQILPGQGIIDGFFAESPYTVKQRSDMVAGDREIEVLNENGVIYDPLTDTQRTDYIAVIQLYDPTFVPDPIIINEYVKVVEVTVSSQLTLSDDTDTYIYANRSFTAKPYPQLADYPPPAGDPPDRSNYDSYDSYDAARIIYNNKLLAIHNYNWYANPSNHFTAIQFSKQAVQIYSSRYILLGKIRTRNGQILKIDTSEVNYLANFESAIKKYATELLTKHTHGGNLPFDPPHVKLESDIRESAFYKYKDGRVTYKVLERDPTSIALGHKHTYTVDANGNGGTVGVIGTYAPHYHSITKYTIATPAYSINAIQSHSHTISQPTSSDEWTSSSEFVVYVNDKVFGDQTTSYIHVNPYQNLISFDKGISIGYRKYSVSFSFTVLDAMAPTMGSTGAIPISYITKDYTYEASAFSVLDFMVKMQANFNATYRDYFSITEMTKNGFKGSLEKFSGFAGGNYTNNEDAATQNILKNHPFQKWVLGPDDNYQLVNNYVDFEAQAIIAQAVVKQSGDAFTFNNFNIPITVVFVESFGNSEVDDVKIEILGNTEVIGQLKPESILYINANKILTGVFEPEFIPFISHAGRIKEQCLPLEYSLVSNDGIRFSVVPTVTDVSEGHYHMLAVNTKSSGITTDVMVGDESIYYATDANNNSYFIYHSHPVFSSITNSISNVGLVNWRNNVGASNVSSSHVHNLVYPVIGNGKTIYSIKEDISGNIYLGTSDGFLIIPSDPAYEFIINDVPLYFYGSDLWTLFNQAKAQYEAETGDPFVVTQDLYGQQISDAVSQLVNDGDSVFFSGVGGLGLHTDYIMIKRVTFFKMPEFGYIKTVPKGYQSSNENEMVIGTATINNVASFVVERDFNDTPIWSIEINTNVIPGQNYIPTSVFTDVIVNGSNLIAKSTGLNKSPYQEWISIEPPFFVNIMRKLIKDTSGSYWICTDMGIMVSRSYSFGNSFSLASVPASNPNIQDILEGETGVIYCASASGIYKTTDGGKTWLELLTSVNGFKQIVKDKSLDKTNTLDGHYHYFEVDSDGNGFLGTSIGTGTQHVHIVTSWVVVETLGHTHSMVATMYALDTNKTIWKSIDNGTTWVLTGSLPSGDCGDIFSAFGYLFVSQNDGLYRSQNTNTWTKILNDKIYSFAWSYDMVELLLGAYNVLYGTRDGSTFTSIYSFVAGPHVTLVENNDKKYFGYAYSNQNETFNFKNLSLGGSEVSALVDFGKWYPQNGSWKNTDKYDVYVNYKRVLSTKFNEDKRDIFGYNFTVYPTDGLLDFGATTELTRSANVYSSAIVVANSSGFAVGDLINIMSNTTYYATIVDISGDNFTLDSRLSEHIGLPATVNKISNLDSNTDVMVNIYNSLLSNIGVLTHEQIEDGLSNYSDGRPYKLNDTYLSNLLQLTQAVRYVYSDINSEFLNSLFYDFRYSFDPLDPFYINKYIDVSTSDIYNQKIYESVFVTEGAKNINRILVGYGAFAGNILVATDVGVFIAQYTENLEANWFYVTQLPYIAYDLMVFGNQLMVATSNGIYYSGDLKTWTLTDSPVAKFPTYCFGLRWIANNSNVVIVPSHTAQFQKDPSTGLGLITATSGLPYKDLIAYRGIYITNAGDKNGNYVIKSILDDGSGYGSRILLTSAFDTPDEIISGVQIEMATWWEQWTGDINDSNPNLTNTILAGQQDKIIINDGGNVSSWVESTVDIVNFIPKQFLPLVNGSLLFIGNSSKETGQVNCLCKSDDLGSNWTTMKTLNEVWGTISSVSISDFNNSVLNVSFTQPQKYVYTNGVLDQHNISIFNNSSSALYSGKIVWNQNLNGQDTITVYGNELYNFGNVLTNCVFIIQPTKINGVVETSHKTLIFATDQGLFDDDTLAIHNYTISSTVVGVGINGTAKAIDISGAIVYITKDTATGYSLLSVTVDANVRATDVVGKSFYITDAFPVEKYEIVANESISVGDYLTIEIKTETLLSSDYIGRRFRIVGSTSRVYTNFDKPVLPNQLNGGNIIISSEDKNGNFGQNYAISSNGLDYIDLKEALVPSTTLVNPPISAEANTSSTSVVASLNVGQNFRVFDSNDKLILWVTLDRNVKENSLVGFKLKMMDSDGNLFYKLSDGEFEPIYTTIISNLNNSITLDTNGYYTEGGQVALAFGVGSKPELEGFMFEQMGGFSHLLTSTNEDHYHQVEMVNAVVSGSILSFSNNNASYVDINVTDTQNFNTSLVQYRGDLFQDAQIIFTLPQSVNLRYISQVISHNATSIRVRIKSASYWNFSAFDLLKVSEGWTWQIDGTNYGYAQDTDMIYNDFEVLTIGITETAKKGDDLLILTNTSGIIVGDKIKIQDDTLSYNIKYVEQVVDTVTLKLTTTLSRTYFKTRNPQIKVLRNIFANTHIHQVRNNEVENITVSDYLDVGYPAQHSHTVLPLIANVTTLLNQGSTIYAIGSSSKLYNSNDNGLTWQKNVDLNDFLEGSLDVMGATTAILNNSKLIVGASDGSLFAQTSVDNVIISNVDPVG